MRGHGGLLSCNYAHQWEGQAHARTPEGDRAGVTSPSYTEFWYDLVYSPVPSRLREHELK